AARYHGVPLCEAAALPGRFLPELGRSLERPFFHAATGSGDSRALRDWSSAKPEDYSAAKRVPDRDPPVISGAIETRLFSAEFRRACTLSNRGPRTMCSSSR